MVNISIWGVFPAYPLSTLSFHSNPHKPVVERRYYLDPPECSRGGRPRVGVGSAQNAISSLSEQTDTGGLLSEVRYVV